MRRRGTLGLVLALGQDACLRAPRGASRRVRACSRIQENRVKAIRPLRHAARPARLLRNVRNASRKTGLGYDARSRSRVWFGARDYDPHTGRWTAKDLAGFSGGSANLYVYAGNEPCNHVDLVGKGAIFVPVVIGVGVGLYVWDLLGDADEAIEQSEAMEPTNVQAQDALRHCI